MTKMVRDYLRYKSEGRIGHVGEPSWDKKRKGDYPLRYSLTEK